MTDIRRLVPETMNPVRLDDYEGIAPAAQLEEVRRRARHLKGVRVVHVNSTANGGGVAEILRSMVPLMGDLGLDVQWYVMPGDESFFEITKRLHNLLQGAPGEISPTAWDIYTGHARQVAAGLQSQGVEADAWIMHDPQSLPLVAFLPSGQRAMWVCHIDTTAPNPSAVEGVLPWLGYYGLVLFSMGQYVLPQLSSERVRVTPPAIDPLRLKNQDPGVPAARSILSDLGVDPERPLMAQVARFDQWKDPWGVIDAYRLVKAQVPTIQLALVGVIIAQDDPEAFSVVEQVRHYAQGDPDIHLFTDPRQVDEVEVAAFQKGADVVVNKSLREGFGLSVAEALWKGTPTVGGRCGGIQLQIIDGETGFLAGSVEECAARVGALLTDKDLAHRVGRAGRERVRHQFLLPRLLADYLTFIAEIVDGSPAPVPAEPARMGKSRSVGS